MTAQSLKKQTARGLIWGGVSNGVQQLLNLLFGIVLARLLTEADYGMIGVLSIFTAVANTLQEGGFIAALANRRTVTHEDYNAVFWFCLFMGVGIYAILFVAAPFIARFFGAEELTSLARYLFLSFVLSSLGTAHSAYLFRHLMVKQKAIAQIPSLLLSGGVGVWMAYHGMSYWGIATQSLLYVGTINLCFWFFAPWRPTLKIDFRPIREMFGFSSRLLVTNIVLQINNHLLATLLGRLYTKADVGIYTQSGKWTVMGSTLIGGMVHSVAQPVLAEVGGEKERQQYVWRKMLRFTAFLSFPSMLGLALIAEEFITITITEKWAACIPILQMLCVWGAFLPIVQLCSNFVLSMRKSQAYMWSILMQCVLQLCVMSVAYPYGLHTMVQVYVWVNLLWLVGWMYVVCKYAGLKWWIAWKDILPFALIATATMVLTHYLTQTIENVYGLLICKVLIAATLYGIAMSIGRVVIWKEIWAYLCKKQRV